MVVPRFVRQALNNEPITVYGDGQQSRCFTYVGDVVEAIVGLAHSERALGEVFNIGSTEEITIENLAQRTIKLTKSQSELSFIPYDQAYSKGFEDMRRRIPDISKIKDGIGWAPHTPLDNILQEVIAYMRTQA